MIRLYCEHLLNIRTISVQATLSTASNKETKATFSADGSILTLTHEGESASIRLPINLSPNRESTIKLTLPAVPSRALSFRVQLEAKEGVTNGVLNGGEHALGDDGNVIPWTAVSLTNQTAISCGACGTGLVDRGTIQEWKDLPSEGWAEMMDFWHCHKPDEPQSHYPAQSNKGYAATGQLDLRPGVAMVGTMNLLFAAEDCKNVKTSQVGAANTEAVLLCANCHQSIGITGTTQGSYQLRKPQLSLSISPSHSSSRYDLEKWLAGLLLSAMNSHGSRKFIAQETNLEPENNIKALKLWIFASDLLISSSRKSSTDYIRVCKVLWQDCQPPAENESDRLTASALSEGELRLQRGELAALRQTLQQTTNDILPEDAREFQGWQVALLERFTSKDLQ